MGHKLSDEEKHSIREALRQREQEAHPDSTIFSVEVGDEVDDEGQVAVTIKRTIRVQGRN